MYSLCIGIKEHNANMIRAGGEDVDCVGDIKDKELKLEEIETSHTLGGACYVGMMGSVLVCVLLDCQMYDSQLVS